MNQKKMWEILVPTERRLEPGKFYTTRYHRVWDKKVRTITGGLTIMAPARGQWINPMTGELFSERMIPVRIMGTREEIDQVIDLTTPQAKALGLSGYGDRNIWFGEYKVWIATPVFSKHTLGAEAMNLPYYEVLVFKRMAGWPEGYYSYVSPVKEVFKWEMTDRNPLAKPKDKESLTTEELEFRTESNSYMDRKDMGMPLVKLSRRHVEQLLQILCQ